MIKHCLPTPSYNIHTLICEQIQSFVDVNFMDQFIYDIFFITCEQVLE